MYVHCNLPPTETTVRLFLGLFSTEQRQSSTSGSSRLSGRDDGRWFTRRFLIFSDDLLLVDDRVHCYLRFFLKYKKASFISFPSRQVHVSFSRWIRHTDELARRERRRTTRIHSSVKSNCSCSSQGNCNSSSDGTTNEIG